MESKNIIAGKTMRLDQAIAELFALSRAQAARAIHEGRVRCNGNVVRKAAKRLSSGDTVTLHEAPLPQGKEQRATCNLQLQDIPILYEDAACLVVDKPQDLVVHPTGTHAPEGTLLTRLMRQLQSHTLLLSHRLDRGTSGCLLVAKSAEACEALQMQFKERSVRKRYLAIVAGIPSPASATIDAPIGRSLVERTRMSLFRTSKSRHAITSYTTLSTSTNCSLLQCDIATGRTHQIRVHLRAVGHPILGDRKYGNPESRRISEEQNILFPSLHAHMLTFRSGETGEEVTVTAPMPEAFQRALEKLGLNSEVPL